MVQDAHRRVTDHTKIAERGRSMTVQRCGAHEHLHGFQGGVLMERVHINPKVPTVVFVSVLSKNAHLACAHLVEYPIMEDRQLAGAEGGAFLPYALIDWAWMWLSATRHTR